MGPSGARLPQPRRVSACLARALKAGDRKDLQHQLRHASELEFARPALLRSGVRGAVQARDCGALDLYLAHVIHGLSPERFQRVLADSDALAYALGLASVARPSEESSFVAAWYAAGSLQRAGAETTCLAEFHLKRITAWPKWGQGRKHGDL